MHWLQSADVCHGRKYSKILIAINIFTYMYINEYSRVYSQHSWRHKAHLKVSLQERGRDAVRWLVLSRQRCFPPPEVFSSSGLFCPEASLLNYKFWSVPRGWNNRMLWTGFGDFGHTCIACPIFSFI